MEQSQFPAYGNREGQELLVATFWIGKARFGLDTTQVQEVVKLSEITPVHQAPEYVKGVMNLRGRIITIIDPGLKLDLGPRELGPESRIFIVNWMGEAVGLLADRVEEAVEVERDRIQVPPENVRNIQSRQIQGICRVGGEIAALLNIDALLGEDSSPDTPGSPRS